MRVLFSDRQLMGWGGRVHLVYRNRGWCVVGPGYVCVVDGSEAERFLFSNLLPNGQPAAGRSVIIPEAIFQ